MRYTRPQATFTRPLHTAWRVARMTRVFAGILFLALLHCPMQSFSANSLGAYSLTLAWDSDPSSDGVTGYRVYFGTTSGNYTSSVDVGNVTTGVISNLAGGVTYFFVVTAYNASGLESTPSAEVSYTPSLPVPPALQTVGISITPARQIVLTLAGAISDHTYNIEATQDLKIWTTIGTATIVAGSTPSFTDANAADFPQRFYRIRDLGP
jgi:hypothetical protein